MASAIAAAWERINDVGAEGDLHGAAAHAEIDLDIESIADSIELPDGKVIYPPKRHGEPIDRVACARLDMQQPSRSRFLRLVGPGTARARAGARSPTAVDPARSGGRDAPRRAVLRLRRDVGRTVLGRVHAPLPEPAARSLTMAAAARSGRRASRGSRA
jgi:hypothetical protein